MYRIFSIWYCQYSTCSYRYRYIFYSTLSYSVCLTLVLSGNYTAKCCFIFIILCVKLVKWHILLCLNCAKKGGKTISWNFSVTFVFLTLSGSSLLVHGHFLGFFLHTQLWLQMFRACAGHGPFRFSPCFLFQLGLSAFWGIIILLSGFCCFFKLLFFFSFFCIHAILEMIFFYPFKIWVPHNLKAVHFQCDVLSNWVQFSSTIQYYWYYMVLGARF